MPRDARPGGSRPAPGRLATAATGALVEIARRLLGNRIEVRTEKRSVTLDIEELEIVPNAELVSPRPLADTLDLLRTVKDEAFRFNPLDPFRGIEVTGRLASQALQSSTIRAAGRGAASLTGSPIPLAQHARLVGTDVTWEDRRVDRVRIEVPDLLLNTGMSPTLESGTVTVSIEVSQSTLDEWLARLAPNVHLTLQGDQVLLARPRLRGRAGLIVRPTLDGEIVRLPVLGLCIGKHELPVPRRLRDRWSVPLPTFDRAVNVLSLELREDLLVIGLELPDGITQPIEWSHVEDLLRKVTSATDRIVLEGLRRPY